MDMSLQDAELVIASAQKSASEMGIPMSVAVVDNAGHLVAFARQDGAVVASLDFAVGKAYTSAVMRMPTSALTDYVQPGGPLYNLAAAHTPRTLVTFAGGQLLGDAPVGAVGVSGGTPDQDNEVAMAGAKAFRASVA